MNCIKNLFLIGFLWLNAIIISIPSNAQNAPHTNAMSVAPDLVEGEKIFKASCASCHKPHEKSTGPALKGAKGHWAENPDMLYKWVKNSSELIASGYPYAVKLFEENNKSVMTAFPALTNQQIDNIFAYIEAYKPPVQASNSTAEIIDPTIPKPINWNLLMLCAILLAVVLLLSRANTSLEIAVNNKTGEANYDGIPFYKAKWFRVSLGIFAVCMFCYVTYDQAAALGRQKNYQPDQPIKFSHQLHAGINQIECLYCHSSADKSKHSGIPSVNVCMNCHKEISKGPKYGISEIDKIYDAAGWDKDKQIYTGKEKPIEWVKIHNLPDHVYFNHQQHVVVGKVACQKCHGEVQNMEKVSQTENLSMGWCINCHRDTEVQFTDNNYYKMYEDFHKELEESKKKGEPIKITEAKMGGLECQKCHY